MVSWRTYKWCHDVHTNGVMTYILFVNVIRVDELSNHQYNYGDIFLWKSALQIHPIFITSFSRCVCATFCINVFCQVATILEKRNIRIRTFPVKSHKLRFLSNFKFITRLTWLTIVNSSHDSEARICAPVSQNVAWIIESSDKTWMCWLFQRRD